MEDIKIRYCKWCDKPFTVPRKRKFNAVKYCCEAHRYFAYLEQHNKAQHKYLKQYRDLFRKSDRVKGARGGLGQHREKDFNIEHQKILNELRRRGLR